MPSEMPLILILPSRTPNVMTSANGDDGVCDLRRKKEVVEPVHVVRMH